MAYCTTLVTSPTLLLYAFLCESGMMVPPVHVQYINQQESSPPSTVVSSRLMHMLSVDTSPPQVSVADVASPSLASSRCQRDRDVDVADEASELPTIHDLMQEVTRLQQAVHDINDNDPSMFGEDGVTQSVFSAEQTPLRYRQKIRTSSGGSDSLSRPGIYFGRKSATNVGNVSPYKTVGVMARTGLDGPVVVAVPKTPPTKRHDSSAVCRTVPRPTRVAALTRENISLLPTPRAPTFTGSVCGSQKSRTSISTDGGGAVFSRLYQPDFYKTREEKSKNIRDRRESFHCSFTPRINRRDSISSRDSIGSGSQTSMMSAKTDVVNVSSRLYDPDYVRKRNARLQRLRQEREMRECTFRPTINANARAPLRKKL